MPRIKDALSKLPDCDDALRRLSDVLTIPLRCRRRACRREGACQGGFGPPCFFEHRTFIVDTLHENLEPYRDYWRERRSEFREGMLSDRQEA